MEKCVSCSQATKFCYTIQNMKVLTLDSPWSSAVFVEKIKVRVCNQFTSIDTGLNCTQTSQHPHLLHVADHWCHLQPLALGVHCVQSTHQVLQEQLKCLRQTQHSFAIDHKCCNFLISIFYNFAVICSRIIGWHHWWWWPGILPVLHHQARVLWPMSSWQPGEIFGRKSLREGETRESKIWRSWQHWCHGDHGYSWWS